jgi:hypothetical protein
VVSAFNLIVPKFRDDRFDDALQQPVRVNEFIAVFGAPIGLTTRQSFDEELFGG